MVDLAFDVRPAGRQRLATPLVLLHAFPLDRRVWQPVADLMPAVDVVLVDLPGMGASPLGAEPPSLDVGADGVAAVLDRIGAARAVLAGVSMGGQVALAFARRHRDRLAGLAMVDSRADADAEPARANRLRMAEAVLGSAGLAVLEPMLAGLLGATTQTQRPELVAQVRGWMQQPRPEAVAWSQRAMAARPDSRPMLPSLNVPAAVVVGEEDTLSPLPIAQDIAAGLPDCVLTVVPRAGHLSPLEQPDAVAAVLTDLLVRVHP